MPIISDIKAVSGSFAFTAIATPPDLTADVTAYDGGGALLTAAIWRQGADVNDRIIHGLSPALSTEGRVLLARNIGSARIILAHDSTTETTAANRFTIAGSRNMLWYPGQSLILAYHATRWRVHGSHDQPRISTPASVAAAQTDWLAEDVSTGVNASVCGIIRASCSVNATIIRSLFGAYDWRTIEFHNVGTSAFILAHEDTAGTAALRFDFGGFNQIVLPGEVVPLVYDPVIARWRRIGDISPRPAIALIQTALTLTDVNTAQTWLPAANDAIALQGNTTYEFEGRLILNTGATTHTTAMSFLAGSGLTVTSFEYTATLWSAAANAIATAQSTTHVSGIASKVLNATSTAVRTVIEFKGIARINAAGTLTPQFTNSAVTGAAPQVLLGSYLKFTPIGAGNVQAIGAWS